MRQLRAPWLAADHLMAIRSGVYRRRLDAELRAVGPAGALLLQQLTIIHDGSCCDLESWCVTLARILETDPSKGRL